MPANRRTPWLIAYDIAAPNRLQRVHRSVRQCAEPLQRSVFRMTATRRQVEGLMGKIEDLIDPKSDDVRAYPLAANGRHLIYGPPCLPEGVLFLDQSELFLDALSTGERTAGKAKAGQHHGPLRVGARSKGRNGH